MELLAGCFKTLIIVSAPETFNPESAIARPQGIDAIRRSAGLPDGIPEIYAPGAD